MPKVTDAMDQFATCSYQVSSRVYLCRNYEALGKNLSIYLLVPWPAPQLWPGTRVLVGGFPPLFVCGAWSVLGDSEVPRSPVHGPLRTPSTLERKCFPWAASRSRGCFKTSLLCLVFAWGPYQPLIAPVPQLIY